MTRPGNLCLLVAACSGLAFAVQAGTPVDELIGTWRIDAVWSDGTALWAQAEYRPVLGGAFVEGRVFVRDGDGPLYQRYRTFFAGAQDPGGVVAHTFDAEGSHTATRLEVNGPLITTGWTMGDTMIEERMELEPPGVMRWKVWVTTAGGERTLAMDGVWTKIDADPVVLPAAEELDAGVAALEPWLGGWESGTVREDGSTRWSRVELRAGLGGRFVDADSWTLDGTDTGYRRSISIVAGPADGDDHATMVTFSDDGSVATSAVRTDTRGVLTIEGATPSGGQLSQVAEMVSAAAFRRRLRVRDNPASAWVEVSDTTWLRQGGSPGNPTAPIDPTRFAAAGGDLRSFTKQRIIAAPVDRVWAAWATSEGWSAVFPPPSAGRIDLAVGGRYEWLFDGAIGGNGSQILSYIPGRMISFSWNAPPSQPETRLSRTWVVVETEELDAGSTRVTLTHLGFGDGPQWDETMAYFDKAWEHVLQRMDSALTSD